MKIFKKWTKLKFILFSKNKTMHNSILILTYKVWQQSNALYFNWWLKRRQCLSNFMCFSTYHH